MSKSTIRNMVISSVLLLSAVSVFSLMVYQVLNQGDYLMSQIESLEKERTQEANYLHLQRVFEKTAEDRAELKKYFLLSEGESVDFLNEIDALAPEIGLTLETDNLEIVVDEVDESEWLKASFELMGTRAQILTFVQILETIPYVSKITSLEIEALSKVEWKGNVTLKVRILTYGK